MLASLRRFFATPGSGKRDLSAVAAWAQRRGHAFRPARRGQGFAIEGRLESRPWRIEWGPSQRSYIEGHELRARMELELPSDQQMLLLSAPLMDALERQAYEQYTDHLQTQINTSTPEEMRWLVMFPKVELSGVVGFRAHFGAVSSQPAVGLAWIEGPLAHLLLKEAETGLLRGDPPLVLITLRGRTYLRLQLADPNPDAIAAVLAIFETAVAQAVQAAAGVADTSAGWASGAASSTWQSLQPDEESDPRKRR